MDKTQQMDKPHVSEKTDWFGRLLVAFMLLVFVPFMIYLEANGTNTSELFSKVMGFVIIGAVVVGVLALIVAVFNRLIGFLTGK